MSNFYTKQQSSNLALHVAVLLPESYVDLMEPLNVCYPETLLPIGNIPLIQFMLNHLYMNSITEVYIFVRNNYQNLIKYFEVSGSKLTTNMEIKVFHTVEINQIDVLKFAFCNIQLRERPFVLMTGPIVTNVNLQKINMASSNLAVCIAERIRGNSLLRNIDAPYLIETETTKNNIIKFHSMNQEKQIYSLDLSKTKHEVTTRILLSVQPTGIFVCNWGFPQQILNTTINTNVNDFVTKIADDSSSDINIALQLLKGSEISSLIDCPRTYRATSRAYLKRFFTPYSPEFHIFNNYEQKITYKQNNESVIGQNSILGVKSNLIGMNVIGDSTQINGTLDGCQIGNFCKIHQNTYLQNVVLMQNVQVHPSVIMHDCVIMEGAQILNNVSIPPGSIIGPGVQLNQQIIYITIRCFFYNLWGGNLGYEIIQHNLPQLNVNDHKQLSLFMEGSKNSLDHDLIHKLPPIYIIRQQMRKVDVGYLNKRKEEVNQQNQHNEYEEDTKQEELYKHPINYLRLKLHEMQQSRTKVISDPDSGNQEFSFNTKNDTTELDESSRTNNSSVCNDDSNDDSNILNNQQTEHCSEGSDDPEDSTTPARLSYDINSAQITEQLDLFWIPNYVIKKAKLLKEQYEVEYTNKQQELEDLIYLKISEFFIKNQKDNGFCYNYLYNQFDNSNIQQAIYSRQMLSVVDANEVTKNKTECYFNNDIDKQQVISNTRTCSLQRSSMKRVLVVRKGQKEDSTYQKFLFQTLSKIQYIPYQLNEINKSQLKNVAQNLDSINFTITDPLEKTHFQECILKTVILLCMNSTIGLDNVQPYLAKETSSKQINKLTNYSISKYEFLIDFLLQLKEGEDSTYYLVNRDNDPGDQVNDTLFSVFALLKQLKIKCAKTVQAFCKPLIENILDREECDSWIEMVANQDEFENDDEKYIHDIVLKWNSEEQQEEFDEPEPSMTISKMSTTQNNGSAYALNSDTNRQATYSTDDTFESQ